MTLTFALGAIAAFVWNRVVTPPSYLVQPDGSTVETPVTLGLNDGINVEIVDGVVEGDLVLQFVPGALGGQDPGGFPMPDMDVAVDGDGVIVGKEG